VLAWHRIVLRQTSPEAEVIFDFILELHRACHGQWSNFRGCDIEQEELEAWLDFAGMFLSSLGNYFVSSTESSSGVFRGMIRSC
jgi:dipeptidyl-peptidase III